MVVDLKKIQRDINKLKKGKKIKKSKDFLEGKKVLHTPKVKLRGLDSEKAIMKGTGNLKLVREVEKREYSPDNRSLFFKDSFNKEVESERKWLTR